MKVIRCFIGVFCCFGIHAQNPISVFDCSIVDPTVDQQEIDNQDDFYKQCILFEASQNYTFGNDDSKEITALKEIHIEKDFHAGSFSQAGSMHLKLEEENYLDVFLMNHANLSGIPRLDKLELGLDLPSEIDVEINNFFNNISPDNMRSPFDPEQLSIEADFSYLYNGNWQPPHKAFGFYYEEFSDIGTDWQNENTQYNFRIRYTPRNVGTWKGTVKVFLDGIETFVSNEFIFEVVPSNLKDFTRIGTNKRYFKIGNEPFFPVGQNLPWVGREENTPGYGTSTVGIEQYHIYHDDMEDLADAGANYFRFIMCPWSNEIEYEKLGHYEDRMNHAWEIDRILALAKQEGLRIHYNLQVHYPFERVNPFSLVFWDWSAANSGAYSNGCNYPDDLGFCYSTELNLLTPKDFLQSSEAMKFYKMRIRYIISRWGYSPDISVLELMSEANNIGEHSNLVTNGAGACPNQAPGIASPYMDDPEYPHLVYLWQNEMCRYIKEDLNHFQHELGVNYTGVPTFVDPGVDQLDGCIVFRGDLSYYSDYVDFWSWNNYTYSPERHERNVFTNKWLIPNGGPQFYDTTVIDKPLMYGEIGLAGANCDFDLTWKNMIAIAPFDGCTGAIPYDRNNHFTTDFNKAERNKLWKTYGYVNDFISGIALDDDNWFFGHDDRNDDKADVTYLRKPTFPRRAMGAIQNKTVNYYTRRDSNYDGTSGSLGNCYLYGDAESKMVYKTPLTVEHAGGNNKLKIKNMGVWLKYKIDWYNPFSGEYSGSTTKWSNIDGQLRLEFPKLENVADSNVVLFKAYRFNQPSFQPPIPITEADDYLLTDFKESPELSPFEVNTNTSFLKKKIEIDDPKIKIVPNPTNGLSKLYFDGDAKKLEISNSVGYVLFTINNPLSGEEIDLSTFSKGIYHVRVMGNELSLHSKILKL